MGATPVSLAPPEQLRALLAQPPDHRVWLDLNACWDEHPTLLEEPWRTYALDHLDAWPDLLRVTHREDVAAALQGRFPPRLVFARALIAPNLYLDAPRLTHLLTHPTLRRTTALLIPHNDLRHEGVQALASLPSPPRLHTLDLKANHIGAEAARTLAASPHLTHLRQLRLTANICRNAAPIALAQSDAPRTLQRLILSDTRLGALGLQALLAVPWPALTALDLHWNNLGAAGARALADRLHHLPNLRTLDLRGCFLTGDDALAILHAARHHNHLQRLNLSGNRFTPQHLADALALLPPHLTHLSLHNLRGVTRHDLADLLQHAPAACTAEPLPDIPFPVHTHPSTTPAP